jgi:hypothetical protein
MLKVIKSCKNPGLGYIAKHQAEMCYVILKGILKAHCHGNNVGLAKAMGALIAVIFLEQITKIGPADLNSCFVELQFTLLIEVIFFKFSVSLLGFDGSATNVVTFQFSSSEVCYFIYFFLFKTLFFSVHKGKYFHCPHNCVALFTWLQVFCTNFVIYRLKKLNRSV